MEFEGQQKRNREGLSGEKEREESGSGGEQEGSEAVSLFTVHVRLFKVRRRQSATHKSSYIRLHFICSLVTFLNVAHHTSFVVKT